MQEATKDVYIDELQMLTGNTCRDINFMYYQLVKDGNFFDSTESTPIYVEGVTVDSFEDWFNKL